MNRIPLFGAVVAAATFFVVSLASDARASGPTCGILNKPKCVPESGQVIAGRVAACQNGQFWDFADGDPECWSCPSGAIRNAEPVDSSNACTQPVSTRAAERGGLFCSSGNVLTMGWNSDVCYCSPGKFPDAEGGETLNPRCWNCPDGYVRNPVVNPSNGGACVAVAQASPATKHGKVGCGLTGFARGNQCFECRDGFYHPPFMSLPPGQECQPFAECAPGFAVSSSGTCVRATDVCGTEGKRACKVNERVPSCDSGLKENLRTGVCERLKPGEVPLLASITDFADSLVSDMKSGCRAGLLEATKDAGPLFAIPGGHPECNRKFSIGFVCESPSLLPMVQELVAIPNVSARMIQEVLAAELQGLAQLGEAAPECQGLISPIERAACSAGYGIFQSTLGAAIGVPQCMAAASQDSGVRNAFASVSDDICMDMGAVSFSVAAYFQKKKIAQKLGKRLESAKLDRKELDQTLGRFKGSKKNPDLTKRLADVDSLIRRRSIAVTLFKWYGRMGKASVARKLVSALLDVDACNSPEETDEERYLKALMHEQSPQWAGGAVHSKTTAPKAPAGSVRGCLASYNGHVLEPGSTASGRVYAKAYGGHCTTSKQLDFVDLNGGTLNDGDQVLFRTHYGYYLSSQSGGRPLEANRTAQGAWEKFTIERMAAPPNYDKRIAGGALKGGDLVRIKGDHGYLSAHNGGPSDWKKVHSDGSGTGMWTKFTFMPVGVVEAEVSPAASQQCGAYGQRACEPWEIETYRFFAECSPGAVRDPQSNLCEKAPAPIPPPAEGGIYAVQNGELYFYRYDGTGQIQNQGRVKVGTGWAHPQVFGGDPGVVYALNGNGELLAYAHDESFNWIDIGAGAGTPVKLGRAFKGYRNLISTGGGAIYGINSKEELHLATHDPHFKKLGTPQLIGTGWGDISKIFAAGPRKIMALHKNGTPYLYEHSASQPNQWLPTRVLGSGWNPASGTRYVLSAGNGSYFLAGMDNYLRYGRHARTHANSPPVWRRFRQVGGGWGTQFSTVFAQNSAHDAQYALSLRVDEEFWRPVAGGGRDVGAGAHGMPWIIGGTGTGTRDDMSYRFNGTSWDAMGQRGNRIDVDPSGRAWIVTAGGALMRHTGSSWAGEADPEPAQDIGIGAYGHIWMTAKTDKIYRRSGTSWVLVAGRAKRIDVDPSGRAWVVNGSGEVYEYQGGDSWKRHSVKARDVSIGRDGKVYLIGTDGRPRVRTGSTWKSLDGLGRGITVDHHGAVWMIGEESQIFAYDLHNP